MKHLNNSNIFCFDLIQEFCDHLMYLPEISKGVYGVVSAGVAQHPSAVAYKEKLSYIQMFSLLSTAGNYDISK